MLTGFYDLNANVPFGQSKLHTFNYDKFGDGSETFNGVDFQATARLSRGDVLLRRVQHRAARLLLLR